MERNSIVIFVIIAILICVILIGAVIYNMANTESYAKEQNVNSVNLESGTKTIGKEKKINNTESEVKEINNKEENEDMLSGKHNVEISVKNYGVIKLELDADIAPITVTNFVKLVKQGFYDGLTFHRIIDGFMIQGGDPLGNGTGGSNDTIKGEFTQNGINNSISHVRGVISMARSSARDSASSQFFIVQKDSTYLDGSYAGFGHVTSGMEIVDKICKDIPVTDNNGTVLKQNQPIIETIKVID